ncbi:DUF4190 domain-containing protein [Aquihabitans sp. McL0605]|uniref:DUF4190 domain-containing protein n=1 Tax=Aquihabitans sp. McL0605 TaxID=3415671 RepID=UPI003CE7D288
MPPGGGYAPSGYVPYGGYGYGPREHPQGTTILVLGILSLPLLCACIGGILGLIAWLMGNSAMKEIDANPSAYTNRSSVQAGRIIGIVSSVLWVVMIGVRVIMAVVVASST